jgi:transposase InsO family protein
MPWHQTDPVNERLQFVAAAQRGHQSMTELCARYGISRKTGYKLLRRFEDLGPEGLRDQSRSPHSHPNETSEAVQAALLRVRKAYPSWGSKKLLAFLTRERPDLELPARSTVDTILKRAGLVQPRSKRRHLRREHAAPVVEVARPNDVWTIDYKGWFKVGDGTRCDPLTVNDAFSRKSLEIRALVAPKLENVKDRLLELFLTFGLPTHVLSDNGPPFGSSGLGGLTRLGVWMLKIGVEPVLIQPGRPDQNGRHERFHETLKAETASPPRSSIRAQQRSFDRFQRTYNEERPHEALDMRTPDEVYEPSTRTRFEEDYDFEYEGDLEVRRVRRDGAIKWQSGHVFLGEAFAGEVVGIEQVADGHSHVWIGTNRLGVLHERTKTVIPLPKKSAAKSQL